MPGVSFMIEHLGAQGLSNVTTLKQLSDTYVGVWNLGDTGSDVPEKAEFLPYKIRNNYNNAKSINGRQQVAASDIQPGGKYRCKEPLHFI